MGQIIRRENSQDEWLNERITADLRERARATTQISDPDFAEDTDYTRDLKKTGRFGWVWAVLVVLALLSLVMIVLI